MKISLVQPKIERGNVEYNKAEIQASINRAQGELIILPEYALTGSLVLDLDADMQGWIRESHLATEQLVVPEAKYVLLNYLTEQNNKKYNCCRLLPTDLCQYKLFPDGPELDGGIQPGSSQTVFCIGNVRFKAIICSDLRHIEHIPTDGLDFVAFIFHFTPNNFPKAFPEAKALSIARQLPVLVSSLVSDQNIGRTCLIDGEKVISLQDEEGILECEL